MATSNEQPAATKKEWKPPRGVRLFTRINRPEASFCVQWRIDGRRQTKAFETQADQLAFAKDLAAGVGEIGVAAYKLNPDEARTWRAFRAQIGAEASLDAVATCWLRFGQQKAALPIREAAAAYEAAKTAEGLDPATLKHYKSVFKHIVAALGNEDTRTVPGEKLMAWINSIKAKPWTVRTRFKRMSEMFGWLKVTRQITENPCDGLKAPKVPEKDVVLLTLTEAKELFKENAGYRVVYRMALEAFGFLRASSAGRLQKEHLNFEARGIRMPGAAHKSKKAKFRQGHPDNLWAWLEAAPPETWTMTAKQYAYEKSQAFIRAKFTEGSKNRLRKTCISAHLAWLKNPPLTRRLAQHTNEKTTEIYEGVMNEADAAAYFQIIPLNQSASVSAT